MLFLCFFERFEKIGRHQYEKIKLNTKNKKCQIYACKHFKALEIFPPCTRWLFKQTKSKFLATNIVILFYFFNFLLGEAHPPLNFSS